MPNPKPASLPIWGDTSVNITIPGAGLYHPGFATGAQLPSGVLNWFWNLVYQWCAYLFDFENNTHTWSVVQTYNAGIFIGAGGLTVNGGLASDTLNVSGSTALVGGLAHQSPLIVGGSGVAFGAGWSLFLRAPRYWKDPMGITHLSGAAQCAGAGNSIVFTLPAAYCPSANIQVPAFVSAVGASSVTILSNGEVHSDTSYPGGGDKLNFDGISFETF